MSNRSRIVLGSLGGAFAIHLAALACSSSGGLDSRDAARGDSGHHDVSLIDVAMASFDASLMDHLGPDVAATDAPSTDAPSTDATVAPPTDTPRTDAPGAGEDAPAHDAPRVDVAMTDQVPTDAGDAPRADIGMLDAIVIALDVAGDVAHDVARAVVDAEVRDAHAGSDAGVENECLCVRPATSTFSFTIDRGRGSETPVARFSSASGSLTPGLGAAGVTGPAVYTLGGNAFGYLADGTRFQVSVAAFVSPAGALVGTPSFYVNLIPAVGSDASTAIATSVVATGVTIPVLVNDRWEMRVASAANSSVAVRDFVFRHSAPGARLLDEPAPAYRP